MSDITHRTDWTLRLRVGDTVEVKRADEIHATLDARGCTDSMPFMPEMLEFCGRRLAVFKRADKTCDTIQKSGGRRLTNVVHLKSSEDTAGVRCDGSAHGGCEASCLLFWHEAWLRRVEPATRSDAEWRAAPTTPPAALESLLGGAAVLPSPSGGAATAYRCQATQLIDYTQPLAWWDPRQYARDLASGNVRPAEVARALGFVVYRRLLRFGAGYRILLWLYNWYQSRSGGSPWPYVEGKLSTTPTGELHLQPGELVRVKSLEQIVATLDTRNKNRGLLFAPEMPRFCGRTFRVLKRVNRIVDEKTGRMLEFSNPCIVLKDVYCRSEFSEFRVFCPRAIYSYWREVWLERVGDASTSEVAPPAAPRREAVIQLVPRALRAVVPQSRTDR